MKKLFSLLLCVVLAFAVFPGVAFAADENNTLGVEFSATVTPESVTNEAAKEVVVSIDANKEFSVDGIEAYFSYPEGFTVKSITCSDDDINYVGADINTTYSAGVAKVGWTEPNVNTVNATNLFVVTLEVAAGTTPGLYDFTVYGFELTANYVPWETGATVAYQVEVKGAPVPVSGISVSPESGSTIVDGEPIPFTATVDPEGADDTTVTWSSSDETVATVDADGNVTGVGRGVATITATTNGTNAAGEHLSASAEVTVCQPVDRPEAITGLVYNGEEQTGVEEAEGYTLEGNTATNAGEYTATATLDQYYVWSDDLSADPAPVDWEIGRKPIDKPEAVTGLVYNGEEQTGVEEAEGFTLEDNTATDAGEYTATATLDDNYQWADGSTDDAEVDWEIGRKSIERPEPNEGLVYNGEEQTGVEEGEGYTLDGEVTGTDAGTYYVSAVLDDNYQWEDGSTDDAEIDWEIEQADLEDGSLELAVGETKELPEDEGITYELGEDAEGIIELDENGNVKGIKEGKATIIVVSDGSGNYADGTSTIVVTVTGTPQTGDMTGRYIMVGAAAIIVLAAYLFFTRKKEEE